MERVVVLLCLLVGLAVAVRAARLRRQAVSEHQSTQWESVDPEDFQLSRGGVSVIQFSSKYCLPCQEWKSALAQAGIPFNEIDVAKHTDLANKYGVDTTPLVLSVQSSSGQVLASYTNGPQQEAILQIIELVKPASLEQPVDLVASR